MGIPFGGIGGFGFDDAFERGFEFGYGAGGSGGVLETVGALLVLLMLGLAILAFAIIAYVLQSKALFTIAKRRGIKNAWLAWLPVGSDWIIGSISDQYRYVVKGNIRNHRKLLLGFSIAMVAASYIQSMIEGMGSILKLMGNAQSNDPRYAVVSLLLLFLSIAAVVISIAYAVYYYVSLYDLFRSCDPAISRRNLLLSIFLGFLTPFLLYACRNKELGMPPRKGETKPAELETAVEVVADPDVAQPNEE